MGKVAERVCMKHKNELGGPLVLRYESSELNCPLCAALENQGSPDERVDALNVQIEQLKKDEVALCSGAQKIEDELGEATSKLAELETLKKEGEDAAEAHAILAGENNDLSEEVTVLTEKVAELEGKIAEIDVIADSGEAEESETPAN